VTPRISVVVATRDRRALLARTLGELSALPERPEVIVVDNASTDGTAQMVEHAFPDVALIRLPRNIAAAARNLGVRRAAADYVAFSDDDSWWAPGALGRAADLFDRHARLGAVAARTLVGPPGAVDPVSRELADSPLPRAWDLPGPSVLGFLACSTVVRKSAFLAAGGFDPVLFLGGEETLLAYDLTVAGWGVVYAHDLVARHFPAPRRDTTGREVTQRRNDVLTCWMRRPLGRALARSWSLTCSARHDRIARRAFVQLAITLPRALARRRRVPWEVEAQIRMLEDGATL
jgi:Predicted glycosyltransferases